MAQTLLPQLTLSLSLQDEATFHNFHAGKNNEIIETLKKAVMSEGEKIIFLHGTRGQGLSHLLQACCHYAYQQHISSVYLPLASLLQGQHSFYELPFHQKNEIAHQDHLRDKKAMSPELLSNLESLSVICFDDIDTIAGLSEWEEAVFHLYNRIYDKGGTIIIAAHDLPKALPLKLPDLVSRLSCGIVYKLSPLWDEEKLAVLMQRAQKRGIFLSEEVGRYILTHCPRHMGTLFAVLDVLDKASLAAQRRLTIPFIKEILEI